MNYRTRATGVYPVTEEQIKRNHRSEVSFRSGLLAPDLAAALGYDVVQVAPAPAYDADTQRLVAVEPQYINKEWHQNWSVVAIPAAEITAAQAAAMQATITAFDAALTAHLDATARQKRYTDRITCMVRAGFVGPFQSDGIAFSTWADGCNVLAYQMLQAVQAGTEPMPESPEAFIATLPVMVWPTAP